MQIILSFPPTANLCCVCVGLLISYFLKCVLMRKFTFKNNYMKNMEQ